MIWTMTTTPAGWYENPDNAAEIRYWDGQQWLAQTSPRPKPATSTAGSDTQKKPRRMVPLWVAVTAGVVGLVFGVMSGNGSEETAQHTEQITELETQVAEAKKEVEETNQGLADAQTKFTEERAELILEAQTAAEEAQAARENAKEATQRALAAEAPSEPEVAPPAATAPEPPAATSTYYENCTAVRDAGASPIRVGQPGYGRHLDRDGDGVGCE